MNILERADKRPYTIDDILNLPEGERAELIDGKMYKMTTPNTEHQEISMYLSCSICNYIINNNENCDVFYRLGVYLNGDDSIFLDPDIIVICDKNKLD